MTKGPAEIAHGPMFIGYTFTLMLYGIMTTQVYLYYNTFKKDRMWMKTFVAVLFLADTVNTIFDAIYLYDSLIIHFVKVLTTNWWLVLLVSLSSLTGLGTGVTPNFVDFRMFKWSVCMWLAGECLGDIMITSVLVWHLRKHKTGFQASDELIDRIIRLTVQTGLVTALCATLDLLFFLIDPTGTHLIFNFPLAKLYTNSVMSSLNSRGAWKYSKQRSTGDATMPSNIITTGDFNSGTPKQSEVSPTSSSKVYVEVESHEMRDIDAERRYSYRILD
ncbi:hypothetical protein BDP27DRAFT_1393141 [Rhodocollybia butyracea]|uniref:DUF6534 domain-containing protein n=1 Tax=Rhodocollybia butyracea TaxID=206335 RepID=A0A9P5PQ08_9AGAR|nr:hypothetical protein BDP27DRAFT_1393141 [Rhodocollybia butyracea]